MKLVAASLDAAPRLPSGPEAAAGTLVHRTLERLGRGGRRSPDEVFAYEYAVLQGELGADPARRHFSTLDRVLGASRWTRLRARVGMARGERAARERTTGAVASPATGGGSGVVGIERSLESRRLRIRGRADEIRRIGPNEFEIRDHKTGGVVDADGVIKDTIALQLKAYGLMLLDMLPAAQVRLVVDDGLEREIGFDVHERAAAEEHVRTITDGLPVGASTAVDLAAAGPGCVQCSVRHACSRYLRLAPTWWNAYPRDHAIPLDVWGRVTEVRDVGRRDIVLIDDAGRRVLVRGVSERYASVLDASAVVRRLWFFGLESTGARRGFDGRRYQPRAFHELPRDGLERRAWALQVFADGE